MKFYVVFVAHHLKATLTDKFRFFEYFHSEIHCHYEINCSLKMTQVKRSLFFLPRVRQFIEMVNGTDSEVRCLGGRSPKSQDSYPVSPRPFGSPSMSPSHGVSIHSLAPGKGSSAHFSGETQPSDVALKRWPSFVFLNQSEHVLKHGHFPHSCVCPCACLLSRCPGRKIVSGSDSCVFSTRRWLKEAVSESRLLADLRKRRPTFKLSRRSVIDNHR